MKNYMSVGERSYFKGVRYTCVELPESAQKLHACFYCDVPKGVCPFVRCLENERTDRKRVVFVRSVREFENEIKEGDER